MTETVFFTPSLGGVSVFYLQLEVFSTRESTLGLTGWTFSYMFTGLGLNQSQALTPLSNHTEEKEEDKISVNEVVF